MIYDYIMDLLNSAFRNSSVSLISQRKLLCIKLWRNGADICWYGHIWTKVWQTHKNRTSILCVRASSCVSTQKSYEYCTYEPLRVCRWFGLRTLDTKSNLLPRKENEACQNRIQVSANLQLWMEVKKLPSVPSIDSLNLVIDNRHSRIEVRRSSQYLICD